MVFALFLFCLRPWCVAKANLGAHAATTRGASAALYPPANAPTPTSAAPITDEGLPRDLKLPLSLSLALSFSLLSLLLMHMHSAAQQTTNSLFFICPSQAPRKIFLRLLSQALQLCALSPESQCCCRCLPPPRLRTTLDSEIHDGDGVRRHAAAAGDLIACTIPRHLCAKKNEKEENEQP